MKICKLWADNKPFYTEFQISFNNEWNNENLYKKEEKKTFLSDALTKIFGNRAMVSVAVTNLHRYHAVVVR